VKPAVSLASSPGLSRGPVAARCWSGHRDTPGDDGRKANANNPFDAILGDAQSSVKRLTLPPNVILGLVPRIGLRTVPVPILGTSPRMTLGESVDLEWQSLGVAIAPMRPAPMANPGTTR